MKKQAIPTNAWPTIMAASFGFAIVQLDVTIVNVALPHMATSLGASVSALQWVVNAYTLVFSVCLLSAGVLADRIGARLAYLLGLVLFALASLGCGLAQNTELLIAARALQGLGAALLVPPSLALINHRCAHHQGQRAQAIGIWTAAGGVTIAAGPVIGGLLIGWMGWRSIFLVNLPLCLLGILLTLRLNETPICKNGYTDWIGQFLAILALLGLVSAVNVLGMDGINNPLALGGGLVFVLGAVLFVRAESRATQPVLPLNIFKIHAFSACIVFGMLANLSYYGLVFVLSLYLQDVKAYSPEQAGLAYLPLTATFIFSNLASGWLQSRFSARLPMIAGALIAGLGYFLLGWLDAHSTYLNMFVPFVLIPLGMGLAVPAMTATVLSSVTTSFAGTASAVLNAARQACGALGVSLFGGFVAGGAGHIVFGLQIAAAISSMLLLIAGVLAWFFVPSEQASRCALNIDGG